MAAKKKKTRRAKNKYAALDPKLNLKARQELIDYDYVDKLSDKDKEWLNKFTEEYINANLNRKNLKKNLHNTLALKKDCDARNNARNQDVLTHQKKQGIHLYIEELKDTDDTLKEYLAEKADDFNETSDKRRKKTNSSEDL